jgi:hypothetical protein
MGKKAIWSGEDGLETLAQQMIFGHVAKNIEEARKMIEEMQRVHDKVDVVVFYTNVGRTRGAFKGELVDESPYHNTHVRSALVNSSLLKYADRTPGLALGKILELVSKTRRKTRLTGLVENFPYQDKQAVWITPYHKTGPGFEEQYPKKMHRVEFKPVSKDYILGMFDGWARNPISQNGDLALWIPREKVIEFG